MYNFLKKIFTCVATTIQPKTTPASPPSSLPEKSELHSHLNLLFGDNEMENEKQVLDEMRFSKSSEDNEESFSSSEIQIDKKLDNGLYRIKIAEITTDEFNNALGFDEGEERERHEAMNAKHVEPMPKFNIDDFYPSKMEDFKPIIEISNEKILKEKNILHNDEIKSSLSSLSGGEKVVPKGNFHSSVEKL